jgi:hypothetical protein
MGREALPFRLQTSNRQARNTLKNALLKQTQKGLWQKKKPFLEVKSSKSHFF